MHTRGGDARDHARPPARAWRDMNPRACPGDTMRAAAWTPDPRAGAPRRGCAAHARVWRRTPTAALQLCIYIYERDAHQFQGRQSGNTRAVHERQRKSLESRCVISSLTRVGPTCDVARQKGPTAQKVRVRRAARPRHPASGCLSPTGHRPSRRPTVAVALVVAQQHVEVLIGTDVLAAAVVLAAVAQLELPCYSGLELVGGRRLTGLGRRG